MVLINKDVKKLYIGLLVASLTAVFSTNDVYASNLRLGTRPIPGEINSRLTNNATKLFPKPDLVISLGGDKIVPTFSWDGLSDDVIVKLDPIGSDNSEVIGSGSDGSSSIGSQGRFGKILVWGLTRDEYFLTGSLLPVTDVTFQNTSVEVVPEPLTILGAGTALIFGAGFKRKLSKSKKK